MRSEIEELEWTRQQRLNNIQLIQNRLGDIEYIDWWDRLQKDLYEERDQLRILDEKLTERTDKL